MARTYAEFLDYCEQYLQDTANAIYDTTELGYWIEDELKKLATWQPHLVDVRFQIESRTGTDTAGTASSLTDTSKAQFLSTDVGKVVKNTTDSTWAVIETYTSTSVVTLNADIMDSGENYEIYNKRCNSKKQIYIGDVVDYISIDSVEYPIGTKRNWEVDYDKLEIMVDTVPDSDSTLSTTSNIDVIVRFGKPQRLLQLTDNAGELSSNAIKGALTVDIDGMGSTEIIERGDEFHIQFHKAIYTITSDVTTSGNAATIVFYPGLEAAATDNDDITFTISTLLPNQEDMLAELVASRAVLSDSLNYINATNGPAATQFQQWANDRRFLAVQNLERTKPKSKQLYNRT